MTTPLHLRATGLLPIPLQRRLFSLDRTNRLQPVQASLAYSLWLLGHLLLKHHLLKDNNLQASLTHSLTRASLIQHNLL